MTQPKDPDNLVFFVILGGSTEISEVLEGLDDLKEFVSELNKDNKEADDDAGVDTGEQSGDSTRSVEE